MEKLTIDKAIELLQTIRANKNLKDDAVTFATKYETSDAFSICIMDGRVCFVNDEFLQGDKDPIESLEKRVAFYEKKLEEAKGYMDELQSILARRIAADFGIEQ